MGGGRRAMKGTGGREGGEEGKERDGWWVGEGRERKRRRVGGFRIKMES